MTGMEGDGMGVNWFKYFKNNLKISGNQKDSTGVQYRTPQELDMALQTQAPLGQAT